MDEWIMRDEERVEMKRNRRDGAGVMSSSHFGPESQSLPHLCLEMAVDVLISSVPGGEPVRGC